MLQINWAIVFLIKDPISKNYFNPVCEKWYIISKFDAGSLELGHCGWMDVSFSLRSCVKSKCVLWLCEFCTLWRDVMKNWKKQQSTFRFLPTAVIGLKFGSRLGFFLRKRRLPGMFVYILHIAICKSKVCWHFNEKWIELCTVTPHIAPSSQ